MIAAFFASEKPHPGADEVAVWCVDLETLAVAAPFGLHGDLDVVTVPRQRNRNLSAQRGLFLISRRESRLSCPLETSLSEVLKAGVVGGRLAEGTCAVRKLCLSAAECPRFLELLRKLGVDRAHLMPSFDGVVAELKSRLERRQAQHIPLVGTDPTADS
jgi:hypothetical protein